MGPGNIEPWVVPVAGAALGIVAAVGLWIHRRGRRSERLRALAALYRWTFTPDSPDLARRWRGTPFGAGSDRRAVEVFTGSHRGHHFAAFTYSFTAPRGVGAGPASGTGSDSAPRVYSVYTLSTGHRVPTVEFTPTGAKPPPAELGGQRIEFASADFNSAWTVTAGIATVAYGIVNPGLVAWLMRAEHAIPLRFEGSDIVTWRPGRLDPATVMPVLDLLVEVATLVPQYVRDAYTAAEARPPHRATTRNPYPPTPRSLPSQPGTPNAGGANTPRSSG